MVPPRHYCVVSNPVARDDDNEVLFDQSGQAKLRHADLEIRLTRDPFPLYPGEEIQQVGNVAQLDLSGSGSDPGPVRSWSGSGCLMLRVFLQDVTPLQIVYPDTALRLQALLDFEDEGRVKRVAGDEWLFEGPGWCGQVRGHPVLGPDRGGSFTLNTLPGLGTVRNFRRLRGT